MSRGLGDVYKRQIVVNLLSTAAVTGDMDVISYATAGGGVDAQAVKAYTLTILDDDDLPKVQFTDNAGDEKLTNAFDEGSGSNIVYVKLSTATEKTVTIPFTFANDAVIPATGANSTGAYPVDFYHADFTAGGTLTIDGDGTDPRPGATIALNILSDAIDEWDEKIIINFGPQLIS